MSAFASALRVLIAAAILIGVIGAGVYGGFELLAAIARGIHYGPHS